MTVDTSVDELLDRVWRYNGGHIDPVLKERLSIALVALISEEKAQARVGLLQHLYATGYIERSTLDFYTVRAHRDFKPAELKKEGEK